MRKFFRGLLAVVLMTAAILFTGVLNGLMSLLPPEYGLFTFVLFVVVILYFINLIIDALWSGKK